MRRVVLLTGKPGVGKTTAVIKAVELLRARDVPIVGFWTEEVRGAKARTGFDIVESDGRRSPLARKGRDDGPRAGSYRVALEEADAAFARVRAALRHVGDDVVMVLDEFGPMELRCGGFRRLAEDALAAAFPLLATYKPVRDGLVDRLKALPGANDWEVTLANRAAVPDRIVDAFLVDAG